MRDTAHLAVVKKAVALRSGSRRASSNSPKPAPPPANRFFPPLAYGFPDGGYENVKDQFLMGDDLLVAPMVTKGTARTVQMPSGQWKADDGTLITGPIQKTFAVPLGRLLHLERQ